MSSYWLLEPHESPRVRPRAGTVDVAIVGGGITGLACALTVAHGGRSVRVHEAREVASGASGRNGGFALRGGAMAYDVAREWMGADAARSYLSAPAVISAALVTGCDAIHPGYGFLSEDEGFAEVVAAHDLVFIGPPANVLERFASKAGQLAGNHFLTITEGLENLHPLGRLTLLEGAQPIRFG